MQKLVATLPYGDMLYEFGDYYGDEFDNASVVGSRLSMVFIEKGSGIATLDDRTIPYIAPCLFCISEKEHFVISKEDEVNVSAILFHPNIINNYFTFENIRNLPKDQSFTIFLDNDLIKFFLKHKENSNHGVKFNLGPFSAKKIATLFDRIHKLIGEQTDPNWPCRSRSYVMELLFLLDNIYTTDEGEEENCLGIVAEEFHPILRYIYHNYEKKLTVADIAEQFHVSRTTLAKMFQENLSESFISFLNNLRVNMAATMLRDTMLPVADIMMRVGFNDNAHFLRTFKKVTGLAPSNYREEYNWMIS